MSVPKSVVKVRGKNKLGNESGAIVKFEDFSDQAEYYMFELTRAALRDVGKYLKNEFRTRYYSKFKRHTGDAGKATTVKVYSGKNTVYPRLDIGLKKGRSKGFYAYFQEFGTSDGKVPKLGILQRAAKDNVETIVDIESRYLSGLSGEASRLNGLIDEAEYDDEGGY